MRTAILALPLALAIVTAGCAPAPSPAQAGTSAPRTLTRAERHGRSFAKQHCARCHAVTTPGLSPVPEAPPFENVVSAEGLTRDTLREFLIDSHNFPAMMTFEVAPTQIDDLSAYMLTLREG